MDFRAGSKYFDIRFSSRCWDIESAEKLEFQSWSNRTHLSVGDAIIPISKGLVFKNHDPDAKIMINDGKVCLEIIELLNKFSFKCKTIVPGKIKSKKGVNFLGVTLNVPSLTSQDENDLALALENGADWVALSFTRTAIDFSLVKTKIK